MRIITILTFLVICHLNFTGLVCAQGGKGFDPLTDDISSKLPPLTVLLDSALAHNPYMHYRNQQLTANNYKLTSKRVDWTRNVGIQFNVGYGNFYNYSSNSSGGVVPPDVATNRTETKYNGTFYLNVPVNLLLDRKNQIRLAKLDIEQAESMAEVQREETRTLVIRQYNEVILKQRLLRIRSKALETDRMNMQMVEKEFLNGVIPIGEYTRISGGVSDMEASYENASTEFLTAYLILEEMVGMKFNLVNTVP